VAKTLIHLPSEEILAFIALFFLLLNLLLLRLHFRMGAPNQNWIAATRWSFSAFTVSLLLLLMKLGHLIPELLLNRYQIDVYINKYLGKFFARGTNIILMRLNFDGSDFAYFKDYVAPWLLFYMIFLNYFVLRFLVKPVPERDKNWQLMLSFYSLFPFLRTLLGFIKFQWSNLSKIGLLALLVKVFYVPLLSSWTINNVFHQINLTQSFSFDFWFINKYLVALFIFVDVFVFAIGYLTEMPQLNNNIKSVEPTLFGWAICLICYPPFNAACFSIFDFELFGYKQPLGVAGMVVGTILLTILWGIYTSASIALGFKASNLTNRGIVMKGPYRFVRHPAYSAKVALWIVSALLLGSMNTLLAFILVIVYSLRAWTEERHLKKDQDYVAYIEKVRWKIFPGVF